MIGRKRSTQEPPSCDFVQVLSDELSSFGVPGETDRESVLQRAHDSRLTGLAFSGGGIRSATFNLGVLQALADLQLLRKFHYLSTVSGGGYIGSWLVAWILRRGGNLEEISNSLRTAWRRYPGGESPEEVRFLRRFSNYLTPKLGWFGADTWTVIAIYLRNMLLNLTALVAGLAFVLMLPRVIGVMIVAPDGLAGRRGLAAIFLVALLWAGWVIHKNLSGFRRRSANVSASDPLDPKEEDVRQLDSPPADAALHLLAEGELFSDFLLRIDFTLKTADSCAAVMLRVPAVDQAEAVKGWEIVIGGGQTGNIRLPSDGPTPLKEQRAMGAQIEPIGSGRVNRMSIERVGRTCTVRLNDRVVNVARPPFLNLDSGRIAVRRLEQDNGVEIHQVLLRPLPEAEGPFAQQGTGIQLQIVVPLFVAAFISVQLLGQDDPLSVLLNLPASWSAWIDREQWKLWTCIAAVTAALAHFGGFLGQWRWKRRLPSLGQLKRALGSVLSLAAGGAIGGLALSAFHTVLPDADGAGFWPRLVFGPPVFILAVSVMLIIYIGLRGRSLPDSLREWWSRLGAWLLIYSILWVGIFGLSFYSPPFLRWLALNLKTALAALSLGWVFATVSGLFAASSPATGRRKSNSWLELLATIGPYVFILGLLAGLAWGVDRIVSPTVDDPYAGHQLGATIAAHWDAMTTAHLQSGFPDVIYDIVRGFGAFWGEGIAPTGNCLLAFLLLGTAGIAALLGLRVDINEFSMHMMYRNRLARCYLGASNAGLRNPQAFTGFDPNDDIDLVALDRSEWRKEDSGPYPIINCALNLVGGGELAWQQRKAASFVFTPKYSGYDFPDRPPGFCSNAVKDSYPAYAASRGPLTLATAMAISGAAASPNMGYHTSPAPAFLMTLFNIRLGWWIGNPRHAQGWRKSSPLWALGRLIVEMFGLTDAKGHYIYLSDGGHFENLGIFELVRRRCRFIVACDAEEDHDFEFGGLGNAIEKCRTDLGVEIDLDVEAIRRRDEQGHSRWHCAVGRIRYDKTDPAGHAGTLLYIKSSLTGDEDTDVLRYAASQPTFPHESTADQWFGESQFESYRALGHHATMSALLAVDAPENLTGLTTERLFVELAQRWYPPAAPLDPAFKRRGETLNALYETLRTEPNLRFLSQQIYPEWSVLMHGAKQAPTLPVPPGLWLPKSYEEVRAGLYFCNRMIQLMEDVYHDLHLEQEYMHPDNRGWINLFKHWAWSRMFRVAWTISAANSGARFQNFCQRVLGLQVGRVKVVEPRDAEGAVAGMREIIGAKGGSEAFLLTPIEKELLSYFLDRHSQRVAQSSLQVLQLVPGGPSDEGPAFTVGIVLLREAEAGENARRILYFRVRDHLRRMGMGRRALYDLLDDDMWERRSSRDSGLIELDLLPPPEAPLNVEDVASRRHFRDLHRGVLLELDGVQQNVALAEAFMPAKREGLLSRWMNLQDSVHQGDEHIPSLLTDLAEDAGEVRGQWIFEDGRRSEVVARFELAGIGTKVTIQHRFLANRDVRHAMERRWFRALNRLAS